MKLSAYTSIIPLNERFSLLFSAKTDKFIVCHKSLLSVAFDGTVTTVAEKLYDQLVEIDALKNDTVDEVAQISELIDKVDNDDRVFHIHVNPTLNCNFRCWYCYEEHHVGSKMSDETMSGILALARNEIETNQKLTNFKLSFFGGEPLMYYNQIAKRLISQIGKLCTAYNIYFSVHFTTNGYLLNREIADSLKDVDAGFQITLDGSQEFHNKVRFTKNGTGSYNTIIGNIGLLATEKHPIVLRINYTSDNIDSIENIIVDLKNFDSDVRNYIQIDFQRVWQNRPTVTEAEILEKIKEYVLELQTVGYRCYYASNVGPVHVGNSCYGDKKKHILVNYDGNLFFCTARDFKPANRAGVLNQDGTIAWNMEKLNRYRTCKFSRKICHRCRIAPLCGGGCRQRASETAADGKCLYGYTDNDIDNMILNRFNMRYL